jgi:chemotaxis protein MotB
MGTKVRKPPESGEFLWLVSLSDLMILLFIFFVVMFSFTYKKINRNDFREMVAEVRHEAPPATPVDEVQRKLEALVTTQGLSGQISVKRKDSAVVVEIKDQVLFESGEFELRAKGDRVLQQLATALEKVPEPYHIGIEGHTDDVPVHTARIADNWDLSGKRALSVLHALKFSEALLKRAVVMAYGEMSPVAPNRDAAGRPLPDNRSRNRRVTIRIF